MNPSNLTLKRALTYSICACIVMFGVSFVVVYNRSPSDEPFSDASIGYLVHNDLQRTGGATVGGRGESGPSRMSRINRAGLVNLHAQIARLRSRLDEMERRQAEIRSPPNGGNQQLRSPPMAAAAERNQQFGESQAKRFAPIKQLPYTEKKRILISGGAGFVGSHLTDRLLIDGHDVIVADNFCTGRRRNIEHWLGHPNFELLHHDIVNPLYVEVDEIYHLASPASPPHYMHNPVKTIKTNTIGTINMLGLAKRVGARILVASTSEVYGDPREHPQRETYWGNVNPIGPRSCYDEGKRVAESLTIAYANQEKLQVRIARIFNTYGPRMSHNDGRLVSNFIAQALQREPLTIYGVGAQTRAFAYVSDLIDGLVRLMASNYSLPINLGNPDEYTVAQVATIVLDLVHRNRTSSSSSLSSAIGENRGSAPISIDLDLSRYRDFVTYRPMPQDDPRRRRPDISLAEHELNWRPLVPLADGLTRTIEYFRDELRLSLGRNRTSTL